MMRCLQFIADVQKTASLLRTGPDSTEGKSNQKFKLLHASESNIRLAARPAAEADFGPNRQLRHGPFDAGIDQVCRCFAKKTSKGAFAMGFSPPGKVVDLEFVYRGDEFSNDD